MKGEGYAELSESSLLAEKGWQGEEIKVPRGTSGDH